MSSSSFDEATKKHLLPHKEVIPRSYGVPKIHKVGIPLRPIINTIGSSTYNLDSFLSKLLSPLVGKSDSFIKNLNHFVQFIKDKRLESNDILVSFDVVSLFTKVPILDSIKIVMCKSNDEVATLVELCLRSTFFSFQGVIYEQVDGVVMGSPLSSIIANLFMEHFDEFALHSFPLKPKWWKRYVDDTNVCCPHSLEKLEEFNAHLNLFPCISFTKEIESNQQLPFLDISFLKKLDGFLGRRVFCKATHTNIYLHSSYLHHPTQKSGVLKTLSFRAYQICDEDYLIHELNYLRHVFNLNG